MDFRKAADTVQDEVRSVLAAVDAGEAEALTQAILGADRVFLTGEGRSGLVAKAFAMRLMHLGVCANVVGETTTPSIEKGNLLIAVSGSGETPVTAHLAKAGKASGARLAAVTADAGSSLGRSADLKLVVPGRVKTGKGRQSCQMPGSLFEQAALLALEAIVLGVCAARGETHDGMRRRHANLE
jgi:6-phospho-3-hexuloisomerase